MTQAEYAAHQGVSAPAIKKRIKSGAIPKEAFVKQEGKVHPLIDSAIADKAWAANRDPAQAAAAKENQRKNKIAKSKGRPPVTKKIVDMSAQGGSTEQEVEKLEFSSDSNRYTLAKTSTEELRSRKLELDILEKEGALLDAEETRKTITKLVTETKEAILNVPAKIGPELLGCTELVELENKLIQALNEALTNLSRLERVGPNAKHSV